MIVSLGSRLRIPDLTRSKRGERWPRSRGKLDFQGILYAPCWADFAAIGVIGVDVVLASCQNQHAGVVQPWLDGGAATHRQSSI
jgi:hypothetical protein